MSKYSYRPRRKITKEVEFIPKKERGRRDRVLNTLNPTGQSAFWHYRKNRKVKGDAGETRGNFSKASGAIFQAISELMLEYEGGVFLEEYGYFIGTIIPWLDKGRTIRGKLEDPYFHTDGQTYCPQLHTFPRRSCIRGMVMDRTFNQKFTPKFSQALFNGLRPKLYYTFLNSIHGYQKKSLK